MRPIIIVKNVYKGHPDNAPAAVKELLIEQLKRKKQGIYDFFVHYSEEDDG